MYTKTLVATILVAFICVQFASSLTCYTCVTEADCKKPTKTTCTNKAANETSSHLAVYHQNVANVTSSSRFDCLALKYTYLNNTIHRLHGCIHPTVNVCGLSLKPAYASWNRTLCNVCSGNKCNKNPAGKMSNSFYTILAATVGLVLVKMYA
ncbi:uncharacterized protein [Drosophila tropicalis]|uniref:uncharacterized protein n=1 Tax=Drosophila tropicalis TaxID=46794 RepID=UPI0035AB8B6C